MYYYFSKICNYWYQGKNMLYKFFVLINQLKSFLLKKIIEVGWDETNIDIRKIQGNKKFKQFKTRILQLDCLSHISSVHCYP